MEGWVDLSTAVKVHSPCSRQYIAAAVAINTTVSGVIRTWVLSHRSQTRYPLGYWDLHSAMETWDIVYDVKFLWHMWHTHPFNGPFQGLPRWAGTRKVKPIWILLKQETVSGSGISWAICKSAPRSRQITMPAPNHSGVFTGWMPFLPPNQQRQSIEATMWHS